MSTSGSTPPTAPATTRPGRLWLALAPAMVVPLLTSLLYFVLFPEGRLPQLLYAGTKLFLVVWPALATVVLLGEPLPRPDLRNLRHWRAIRWGVLSGLALAGAGLLLLATPVGEVVRAAATAIRGKAQDLGVLDNYWPFALFLSLAHSLLEEYYWRWFVYGGLRRVLPRSPALALAGAAFAAHHVVVASQFFGLGWGLLAGVLVAAAGIVWSLHWERQGTLAGAWVSHAVVDLAIMTIGHRLLFG